VAANDIWKLGCTSASGARRQHDHRRQRQRSDRHGPAVRHDGDQHHGRHVERPLRGDLGARQQQIKRGRGKRPGGGPFLDGKGDGQHGGKRQQRADGEEHDARDDSHVISRNRSRANYL
jgi:hypothetical protein